MASDLSAYTVCELMGLIRLDSNVQMRCARHLETLAAEVFLPDELALGLPDDELWTLTESLQEEGEDGQLAGAVPMASLPVLEARMQARLEWFVTTLIREEIKYLINLHGSHNDFAQSLLWGMLAPLRQNNWRDVVMSMGYLAAKRCIPQQEGVFLVCFEAALDRYHEVYDV